MATIDYLVGWAIDTRGEQDAAAAAAAAAAAWHCCEPAQKSTGGGARGHVATALLILEQNLQGSARQWGPGGQHCGLRTANKHIIRTRTPPPSSSSCQCAEFLARRDVLQSPSTDPCALSFVLQLPRSVKLVS